MSWLAKAGATVFVSCSILAFLYALWDSAAFDAFLDNVMQAGWRTLAFGGFLSLLGVILHAGWIYLTDLKRRAEAHGHIGLGLLGETLIQVGLPKLELGIAGLTVGVLGLIGTHFHVHP